MEGSREELAKVKDVLGEDRLFPPAAQPERRM